MTNPLPNVILRPDPRLPLLVAGLGAALLPLPWHPWPTLVVVVFGLIIATISCGWGLTTKGGPKEVGTSTTGAVVMILILVCIMDVVLTQVLFGA